jgi:hypothetical protein
MANDLDFHDVLDDADGDSEPRWERPQASTARSRDSRRVIEELREQRRLRELLADYDLDDGS